MPRDVLEMDVVYVGGGPAALTSAWSLKKLVQQHNQKVAKDGTGKELPMPQIAVIDKASKIGNHSLSGAVLDTRILADLREIAPDETFKPPFEAQVTSDNIYFLTKKWKFPVLFTPPSMHNKGYQIITLGKWTRWLGDLAEKEGVEIFAGFSGTELLEENGKIVGVRTGDMGRDKEGNPKSDFQEGVDIRAKVVVLAEGTHGHLTKKLIADKKLDGANPMCYATGVKEVWQLPDNRFPAGKVVHTMGWPLGLHQFGGSFIYGLDEKRLAIGLVVGLDSKDPFTDAHRLLQEFKQHPYIANILKGAELERYGAKTIPEGGYWSIPQVYGDGFMILGDSASFVNVMRLKGIHLAMKSGMLAAETIVEALAKDDFTSTTLKSYHDKVESSWIKKEMWKVRNFRQGYHKNLLTGMFHTAMQILTGGRGLTAHAQSQPDHTTMAKVADWYGKNIPTPAMSYPGDKKLTFDKLTSVYHSGTLHEENQPCHLKVSDTNICVTKCTQEYGNPCQYFCPANVYEIISDPKDPNQKKLQINFTNCVHCKTCDIMDPYQVINWTAPEAGGGPSYSIL